MTLDDDIRILSGVDLFAGFTQDQLRLLAFGAELVSLGRGRKLYQEDDVAESAYVVVSGSILLYRDHGATRVALGSVGSGGILGELALIAETTRLTCAAAETEASLLRLDRRTFRRMLEAYPDIAADLYARIAEQLKAVVDRLEAASDRLAQL